MENREKEIWNRCLKGDMEAFKSLCCQYYSALFYYGLRICCDEELVKDTIQEFFVKMIQNCQNLSSTESIKSYLMKGLRNKLYDYYASCRSSDDISCYDEVFVEPTGADDRLFSDERLKHLYRYYRMLPHNYREVIYLFYVDELSHREISDILKINIQSSKNLLHKAITKLKHLFIQDE